MAKKDLGYTLYEEDIWVGYRHFNTRGCEVAYPFGYGLSYTTFAYGTPTMKVKNGRCKVAVKVTNTGKVSGKEWYNSTLQPLRENWKNRSAN